MKAPLKLDGESRMAIGDGHGSTREVGSNWGPIGDTSNKGGTIVDQFLNRRHDDRSS